MDDRGAPPDASAAAPAAQPAGRPSSAPAAPRPLAPAARGEVRVLAGAGAGAPRRAVPWSRLLLRPVQLGLDGAVLSGALVLAYLLRFDFDIPPAHLERLALQLPVVVGLELGALTLAGVYGLVWRYIGLADLEAFGRAALLAALPLGLLRLAGAVTRHPLSMPLSIIVLDIVLGFAGVLALRVARRALFERYERLGRTRRGHGAPLPVLLVGAGRAGVLVARELAGRPDAGLEVRGFLDDDPEKQGLTIQGIPVVGVVDDLGAAVRRHDVDHVIITIARATRAEMRRIVEVCDAVPVRVRTVPGLCELVQGRVEVSRIRDVEIEDLLGREPVQLDEGSVRALIRGRTVMVTGAGGSIGSELARQVARFEPALLVLLERAEGALFTIDRELRERHPTCASLAMVADCSEPAQLERAFAAARPEVVLHAAAHKHVPLMEQNPAEAFRNNVLGTRALAEQAHRSGALVFVLISTDKAVRPTSVMGATKRAAELVLQDLQRRSTTRFVAVRFGNVLASAGSVIPIFREQILRGGPVTVTHPDMVRYFMTIPEASQLVLQAAALGDGGEIFVLDMGEPVRILDLAKDMITLSGLRPYDDVDIAFTGVRPGEKLFEELHLDDEAVERTRHPKIFVGRAAAPEPAGFDALLRRAAEAAARGDDDGVREGLAACIPEARLGAVTPARAGRARSQSCTT